MKKIISITIIILIIAMITGCSSEKPKETVLTIDPAGNEITIPEEINSIISMAPSITEVLVELGFGDKIIAVDNYSVNIPGLPDNIPSFDIMTPDAEQLTALNPDIIFATGMSKSDGTDPFKPIKDLGISIVYIPSSDSIEAIYDDIIFIAKTMQVSDKGNELVDEMKAKINEINEISKEITDKKTVYFEINGKPKLYSFGKGVFLNEMIELVGATNVLNNQDGWIAVSDEVIVASNPDIIFTNVNNTKNAVDEIKARPGWENINAVKNDNVYFIDKNSSSHPNHNIIKALEQIAEAIYPNIY